MVDEGENALGVVSGDEFCGLANVVHVCAVGRARDLQGRGRLLSPGRALGPAAGLVAIGERVQTRAGLRGGGSAAHPPAASRWPPGRTCCPARRPGRRRAARHLRGAPKNASAVNAQNLPASEVKHAVLASIHLPPCLGIFPLRNLENQVASPPSFARRVKGPRPSAPARTPDTATLLPV